MTKPRVFALIPFYNNAKTIHEVVRATARYLPVIVVDDGSTDNPPDMSEADIIHHKENLGKGAALLTGLKKAEQLGATHVVTIDGDGQHLPSEIPRFIEAVKQNGDAIWIGKRIMKGPNVPKSSIHGRSWSNFWIWFHTRIPVPDALSGFRLYPVERTLKLNLKSSSYVFESEALVKWGWAGLPIKWLDISVVYQPPEERVSHFRKGADNVKHTIFHTLCFPVSVWYRLTGKLAGQWWEEKPKGYKVWYRLFLLFISLIGRAWAYKIAHLTTAYYFVFESGARANIKSFLEKVQPGEAPTLKNVWRAEKAFGESLVDRISRLSGIGGAFDYKVIDRHYYEELYDENRGLIFLSAHFGPWDIGARLAQDKGLKMCMLMNRAQADHAQDFFDDIDSGNMKVITVDGGFGGAGVVNALVEGWNVAMHGDRIMEGQRPIRVSFLGAEADFPSGPYQMSYVTGAAIIPTFSIKTGDNDIEVRVFPPILPKKVDRAEREKEVNRMATEYVERLESIVKEHPEQWFNFYDFFKERS